MFVRAVKLASHSPNLGNLQYLSSCLPKMVRATTSGRNASAPEVKQKFLERHLKNSFLEVCLN